MNTPPPLPHLRRGFGFAPGSAMLLVAAFLVFLLFRPYQGIIHDARLYVGYAMAALDPDGIGRDIVFVNDGQSKFSVYPLLMRSLAEWVGPSRAAMALTYSGLLLWFAAFAALVRRLLGERFSDAQVIAVIVLAVSLPSFYGGQGVFRFAEHFATPRAFAEASVLAAFAAILARRTTVSLIALALGLAFHPLMTAPGVGVVVWYLAESRRSKSVLMFAAVGAIALLLVATLTLNAAAKPFAQFDAQWMAAINTKHALVFLRTWRLGDFGRIVLQVVTVTLALPLLHVTAQRLLQGCLLVAAAGVATSVLGGDFAHNVLVTQVQAWRALWLLAALATIMQGVLLCEVWRRQTDDALDVSARGLRRAASLLLLLAWFMVEINSTAIIFAVLASLLWTLPRLRSGSSLPPEGAFAIAAVAMALIASVVAVQAWVTATTVWISPDTSMRWSWFNVVTAGLPGLFVLVSVHFMVASTRAAVSPTHLSRLPLVAGLAMLVFFALDARTQFQKYVESELDARSNGVPAPVRVPRGSSVLWPYADLETWALAGAPGWGTIVQGMPSVFNRQLSIMWAARSRRLAQAGLLPIGQTGAETIAVLTTVFNAQSVERLCAQPDAPSIVVLPNVADTSVSPVAIFKSAVNKVLYPSSMGQPWGTIRAYAVVRCERSRHGKAPAREASDHG